MPMSGHRYPTRGAVNGRRWPARLVSACILEAIARDALGQPAAADPAVAHALGLAGCP